MLSVGSPRCPINASPRCLLHFAFSLTLLSFSHVAIAPASSREARVTVQPVDCVLSDWSPWSRCDICQKKRYRHAKLIKPSQFGGEPCNFYGREEEECTIPAQYTCNTVPLCEGFLCTTTGRCIPRHLRCNGEDECGDMSDELGCAGPIHKACRQEAEEYWGIENLAKGINALNSHLEGVVLDNRYYAGSCLPQYIQDVRFRKPYNLQEYTTQTKGSYDFTMQSSSSSSVYLLDSSISHSSTYSFSFGIAIPQVAEFGFSYNESNEKKSVSKIRRASSKANSFVWARAELELAQYVLKPDDLVLHPEFLQRLRALPSLYLYGEYRQIYKDYGTHYVTDASLGGNYEFTIVLDKEKLEKSDYSLDYYKDCIQLGMKVGANIDGVYVSVGVDAGGCDSLLNEMGKDTVHGSMVEDFIVTVRGGSSESIAGLLSKTLPTSDLMRLWGEGIRFNPAFIRRTTRPLYELVIPRDFSSADTLKRNMKRALAEYLEEASPCRCAPCLNNGIAVLKGTRCDCICPTGYSGKGCEITKRRKDLAIQGSWSCWGAWSPCSHGSKTRSRRCDNPEPSSGGLACRGPTQESKECY